MVFPVNIHVGPAVINAHIILEALAYTLGFQYYIHLRKGIVDKISTDERMWLIVSGAVGALIGSRCVGLLSMSDFNDLNLPWWAIWLSAKSVLGGLLGGIAGVEVGKKLMKINVYTGDLFVYPIILAIMIGRLGCFSQGVFDGTHGTPADLSWAIDMGDGIRRHPVQIYEIIFLGILWLWLKACEHKLSNGALFKIFMMSYLLWRFCSEWIKPVYFYPIGLSGIQIACLAGGMYFLPSILNPRSLLKDKANA